MIDTQLNQQTRPISSPQSSFDGIYDWSQELLGVGSVVLWSEKRWGDILLHFNSTFTCKSLRGTFYDLMETWRYETKYLSSVQQIADNVSYQQIVGLGEKVLPLIFEEMHRRPGHWFLALQRITRENPIQPQHRGNMEKMTDDWLNWGRKNGYIQF